MLRVSARAGARITTAYVILSLGCFAWMLPGLLSKNLAQKNDTSVALTLDAESLDAMNGWAAVPEIPCTHIVLDAAASSSAEARVRALQKNVLWRVPETFDPGNFLSRIHAGDLVWLTENALEHPLIYLKLPDSVGNNGGVCALEFDQNPALPVWTARFPVRVLKTHVLGTREMMVAKPEAWRARLCRAVEERWVRCLIVHLSPALSISANVRFLNDTVATLRSHGFTVENRTRRLSWPMAPLPAGARWTLVLLFSITTPLLLLYWVRRLKGNALVMFVGVSAVSVMTGIVIHSLGATPAFVLGLEPLRGLKLQLCGALLLAVPFLFSKEDVLPALKQGVAVGALASWIVAGCAVLALYWMRSGNHPLLPVSEAERRLRDVLETFFVVRPRFKEFLFGHPLFLAGLWLTRRPVVGRWWGDGRIFLWLGLVGQVSILNTFTHFHTPFFYCVIRTLHGLWLGLALAILGKSLVRLQQ